MSDHDHSGHKPQPSGSFWTSRTGVVLIAFLAVVGLLLAYEHRAHIFTGYGVPDRAAGALRRHAPLHAWGPWRTRRSWRRGPGL